MNENDTKKLLAELYGLRAGLSLISVNEGTIKSKEQLIQNSYSNIKYKKGLIDTERNGIAACRRNIPELEKKAIEIQKELEEWQRNEKKRYDERVIIVTNHNAPESALGINLIIGFFFPPLIPIFIISYFVKRSKLKKEIHARYDAADKQHVLTLQNQYRNTLNEIDMNKQIIDSKIQNHSVDTRIEEAKDTEKSENKNIAQYAASINEIVDEVRIIDKTLVERYSPIINQSDWANLDLVIYYLETGRADSIKEALQLTDRQLQTDQITNAVMQAAAKICQTIERCTIALGNAMLECFNILSEIIIAESSAMRTTIIQSANGITSAISKQTDTIKGSIAASTASNAVMCKRLENALKIKSSVSSQILVSDMQAARKR